MKTISRTRDNRGHSSVNGTNRHTNDNRSYAKDLAGDMSKTSDYDKPESTTSRGSRRDGARAPNAEATSPPRASPNTASSSGRSSAGKGSPGNSTSSASSTRRAGGGGGGQSPRGHDSLLTMNTTVLPIRPGPSSPLEAVAQHLPLNDIDYESNPAAVAQELSNLQALRRMSMDAGGAAADPDLPEFGFATLTAPTGADNDSDARRLFWVPARLHPELAPERWKAFVESKMKEVQSPSGRGDSLSPDPGHPGLRRKKSMLSKQIDNTGGKAADAYEDGAERLERKKSRNGQQQPILKVSDLESLVSLGASLGEDTSALIRKLSLSSADPKMDMPILPPLPGPALRRSNHTRYRRGGRAPRVPGADTPHQIPQKLQRVQTEPMPVTSSSDSSLSGKFPDQPLESRMSREPKEPKEKETRETRESKESKARLKPTVNTLNSAPAVPSPSRSFEDMLANSASAPPAPGTPVPKASSGKSSRRSTSPSKSFQTAHARKESQGGVAPVPRIVEPSAEPQLSKQADRSSATQSTSRSSKKRPSMGSEESGGSKSASSSTSSLPLRSDSLSTASQEDKKDKRGSRSDSVTGARKPSWVGRILGESDKEPKGGDGQKEHQQKEKLKKSKTSKSDKGPDKEHARLDVIQKSIDGRESPQSGSEKEHKDGGGGKKSTNGETSGSKKEKDSGLFSSLFGGSRKKSNADTKLKAARSGSPDRTPAQQQNFYWTRFPIHIERAIYKLSHLKLANPRRPLREQVLLSNFMYSYLAKIQMSQPALLQQQQLQQQERQQQQLQMQQQHNQEAYEQQQLQQGYLQYEPSQYDQHPSEQYYQYDDGTSGMDYGEEQLYEYDDDDMGQHGHHQQHQQQHLQHLQGYPPRSYSHGQGGGYHGDDGYGDGGGYEQQQQQLYHQQQYYSPTQQQQQMGQYHVTNGGGGGGSGGEMW